MKISPMPLLLKFRTAKFILLLRLSSNWGALWLWLRASAGGQSPISDAAKDPPAIAGACCVRARKIRGSESSVVDCYQFTKECCL